MTGYSQGARGPRQLHVPRETGVKRRPAVILSSDAYHQSRQEAIIAAITRRTDRVLVGDQLIANWREAGLLFPSVATGIIGTIKHGMIARKLGAMATQDMQEIDNRLRFILELG